jgi:hypothetical protein
VDGAHTERCVQPRAAGAARIQTWGCVVPGRLDLQKRDAVGFCGDVRRGCLGVQGGVCGTATEQDSRRRSCLDVGYGVSVRATGAASHPPAWEAGKRPAGFTHMPKVVRVNRRICMPLNA